MPKVKTKFVRGQTGKHSSTTDRPTTNVKSDVTSEEKMDEKRYNPKDTLKFVYQEDEMDCKY